MKIELKDKWMVANALGRRFKYRCVNRSGSMVYNVVCR